MIVLVGLIGAVIYVLMEGPKKEGLRAEMPTYHTGDEWVYQITSDVGYTCRSRVTGEEEIMIVENGIPKYENTYVIEQTYEPPYLGFSSEVKTWEKKETGDTLRTHTSSMYWGEPHTWIRDYAYKYPMAGKWPLEIGKEYTRVQTRIGVENVTSVIGVEKWEDVSVPAGKFPCFKLVYYDENSDIRRTEWYSGLVKRNIKWVDSETGETWELTSYSTEEGSLAISGLTELEVGDEVVFIVTSRGSPVEGAIVEVNGDAQESGDNGTVAFTFNQLGEFTATATKEGYDKASIPIKVKSPPEDAPYYEVIALVNSVQDGDTIDTGILKLVAELDPAGEVSTGTIEGIRFGGGIDAPESYENGGSEAGEFVEELIPPGTVVYLDLDNLARGGPGNFKYQGCPYRGHYGRLVAVIYAEIDGNWVNINAELLRWGMEEYPRNNWDEYTDIESEFDMYEWPPYDNDYPYVR